MDAILSRVGDAELRQHCEAAVVDQLRQSSDLVQHVVTALEKALKVAQASREVHPSLVLNDSELVQASFRQLGESCNRIGPLLRLLHRDMGPATPATTATTTAASEEEDDEPEVVEVSPPRKKRKAETLGPRTPVVKRQMQKVLTPIVREKVADKLKEIRATAIAQYSVTTHKELASFVKEIFATDSFDNWQPRDDPKLGQLLNEMESRVALFKDSATQDSRVKALSDWQKEMTVASFAPTLDLTSIPPRLDPCLATSKAPACKDAKSLRAFAAPGIERCNRLRNNFSNPRQRKQTHSKPLLEATTKFFAVVANNKSVVEVNGASQNNNCLRVLSELASSANITRKECERLEELLYYVRIAMQKHPVFCKKAIKLVPDLLQLFPQAARPRFSFP